MCVQLQEGPLLRGWRSEYLADRVAGEARLVLEEDVLLALAVEGEGHDPDVDAVNWKRGLCEKDSGSGLGRDPPAASTLRTTSSQMMAGTSILATRWTGCMTKCTMLVPRKTFTRTD